MLMPLEILDMKGDLAFLGRLVVACLVVTGRMDREIGKAESGCSAQSNVLRSWCPLIPLQVEFLTSGETRPQLSAKCFCKYLYLLQGQSKSKADDQ